MRLTFANLIVTALVCCVQDALSLTCRLLPRCYAKTKFIFLMCNKFHFGIRCFIFAQTSVT
jgi:hypothetical protein